MFEGDMLNEVVVVTGSQGNALIVSIVSLAPPMAREYCPYFAKPQLRGSKTALLSKDKKGDAIIRCMVNGAPYSKFLHRWLFLQKRIGNSKTSARRPKGRPVRLIIPAHGLPF